MVFMYTLYICIFVFWICMLDLLDKESIDLKVLASNKFKCKDSLWLQWRKEDQNQECLLQISSLLWGWMKKRKFPELFDDSGLDRRKFHQKKNFQEIASFWLWLESWHLQLKCVLPRQKQKYNKSWKITKGKFLLWL